MLVGRGLSPAPRPPGTGELEQPTFSPEWDHLGLGKAQVPEKRGQLRTVSVLLPLLEPFLVALFSTVKNKCLDTVIVSFKVC